MLLATATGFATGFSLILAIGAQNAFVLRQGLLRAHVFWVCLVCALSDAVLIALGVAAADSISAAFPSTIRVLTWFAAVFLIAYGALGLCRAMKPGTLRMGEGGAGSLRAALVTCLALTWLNPHVYLDTVGLIGAVSMGFGEMESRLAYGIGASLASFAFFFALGYGARVLTPLFALPRAWTILDLGIALVMWAIAVKLILGT